LFPVVSKIENRSKSAALEESARNADCSKVHRLSIPGQWRIFGAEALMTARAGVWKRKREDLKNRRAPLFKRYEKSPNDLCLAREIKILDDQIAECTEQIERENRGLEPAQGSLSVA
jgi:hypothetical protein